jgi:hypothetical protein
LGFSGGGNGKVTTSIQDVTGTPRPLDQIEAALTFVNLEMKTALRMLRMTEVGPAIQHLIVIRELLLDEIRKRGV